MTCQVPRLPVFVLAAMAMCASISVAQDNPERQQVELAERTAGRAAFTKDFATVEKYWSPEMLVNSPGNRVLTRDQVFAAIREDKLKYSGYTNEIEAFHTYGDIAVIMGHETLIPDTGPEAGTKLYRRFTDVWQRSNGGWVQIARQATYTDEKKLHYDQKVK